MLPFGIRTYAIVLVPHRTHTKRCAGHAEGSTGRLGGTPMDDDDVDDADSETTMMTNHNMMGGDDDDDDDHHHHQCVLLTNV